MLLNLIILFWVSNLHLIKWGHFTVDMLHALARCMLKISLFSTGGWGWLLFVFQSSTLVKARGIFFFLSLHGYLETEESCRPRIRNLVQRLSLCLYLFSHVCHMPPEKLKYNLDGRKLLWGEDVLTVAALRLRTGSLGWMFGERCVKEHLSCQGRLCLDLVLSADI